MNGFFPIVKILTILLICNSALAQNGFRAMNDGIADSIYSMQYMDSLFKKSYEATLIPKFDTNYFYKKNGELDTLKVLSDTTFHWGGHFFMMITIKSDLAFMDNTL